MKLATLAMAGVLVAPCAVKAAYPSLFSQGQLPANLSVTSLQTASVLNVRNFGATGDGVTDDTAAFIAAINQVNARLAAGHPATLYIPAGIYYLNGATPLPTFSGSGSLVGDGPHKSYIKLGPNYSGDVFSWSTAWMGGSYNATTLDAATDLAGAHIQGLSVIGSRDYTNQQNAFVFYDRDDMIDMRDVQAFFVDGHGLYMGVVKNVPGHAYIRESRFSHLLFWQCGNATTPAVEINSIGPAGDDATNELSFYGLDVIQPFGPGLVIHNANASIPVRLIRFFGLRVEGGAPGETGDLVDIGDPVLPGRENDIQIYGFESNIAPAGYASVRFSAASGAAQPSNITLQGSIGTSHGDGVDVDAGRQIRIILSDDYTPSGYGIVIGPASMVGGNIEVDGDGAETTWTYKIDPTSATAIRTPFYPLFGDPSSGGARAIMAGPRPDGTSVGGNTRGTAAVDMQTSRTVATQVASGNYAAILSGQDNTAAGLGGVVLGGASNSESGSYGVALGGLDATDRGRYGTMAFASGNFGGTAVGDAERVAAVLRASVASGSTGQLTSDGAAAGTANILNLSPGMAGTYSGYVTVRDTVTGAMYSFFVEFGVKRPGAASTTAVTWQNVTAKGGDASLAKVSLSISADDVNGGVTLSANDTQSPSGNPLHLAFTPTGSEVQ